MKNVANHILSILALVVLVSCGGDSSADVGKDVPPAKRAAPKKTKNTAETKRDVKKSTKLIDLMPPDSIVFFHLPDFSRTRAAFTKTALHNIFQEREVQRAFEMPLAAIAKWVKQIRLQEGIPLTKLLKEIDGETVIAATRDHVFAAIELGDAYLATDNLIRRLGQDVFDVQKFDKTTSVYTARSPGGSKSSGPKVQICLHKGRWLIATLGEGAMERVLDGYESLLSKSEQYTKAVAVGFGKRADYRLYVDLEQLVAILGDEAGPEAQEAVEVFDLDAMSSLVMAGYMEGTEFFDRIALVTHGKEHLFSRIFRSGKPTEEMLACVPDACESLSYARMDLTWLPEFIQAAAASFDENVAASIGQGLAVANTNLGMPVAKFLDALGDSWFLMSIGGDDDEGDDAGPMGLDDMMAMSGISGTILAVYMKEPKLVKAALTHLANARPEVSPARIGKYAGFAVRTPRMGPSAPAFSPHVVIRDNLLIAAVDRKAIYRYLERDGQSILRNPTFEFRWRAMPDTICGLGFTDLRPGVSRLLEAAKGFLPLLLARMAESDIGMPLEFRLPKAGVINRHLTPITTSCELVDDGLVLDSRSPIGSVTVMVPVIAIVSAIAIPNLIKARQRANQAAQAALDRTNESTTHVQQPRTNRPTRTSTKSGGNSPRSGNEHSTLYVLKTMVSAQEMFRKATNIDVDRDGVGEFGTFAELSGSHPLRGAIRSLDPPILTATFGDLQNGLLRRRGYYFQLFLPGQGGAPRAERKNGGAAKNIDADLAEAHWCVVAWPVDQASGERSFYVDQKGVVYATRFPYRGLQKPLKLESILQKSADLRSGLTTSGPAADGSQWHAMR